jgi:hypothetical protein
LALDIYEMAIRILVASAAGALIGYERYVQEFRIASPETERTDMRAVDNAIEWPVSAGLLYGRCWPDRDIDDELSLAVAVTREA